MSSCATQVFSNVTPAQFDCLSQNASAAGINISGNTGSASQDGITVEWTFDPTAATLSIQCTSAPFFALCGTINSKIHDLVESCLVLTPDASVAGNRSPPTPNRRQAI